MVLHQNDIRHCRQNLLTFLETWHHENYGGQPDFQNIWLVGWDITARPVWKGSSPPLSRTTSPALTRMSTSVIKSVFESATSLLKILCKIFFFLSLRFLCFLRNSHFISNTPRIYLSVDSASVFLSAAPPDGRTVTTRWKCYGKNTVYNEHPLIIPSCFYEQIFIMSSKLL